jgi:hypothetical protein
MRKLIEQGEVKMRILFYGFNNLLMGIFLLFVVICQERNRSCEGARCRVVSCKEKDKRVSGLRDGKQRVDRSLMA